jgi:hypothetical protein
MTLPALRSFWTARWTDLPRFRSRDHLWRATAYRLQTQAHGGLAGRARRELEDLAQRFTEDRGFDPGLPVHLKIGSSLIREWGGRRHEVAVVDDGFVYDGQRFRSLSKVATVITGTKWNGPVFFGVKPRGAQPKTRVAA